MEDGLKGRCRELFCTAIEVDNPAQINWDVEVSPETVAEWDSLSHVRLLAALEKEFKIVVTPEEGVDLESFDAVCRLVARKVGATS